MIATEYRAGLKPLDLDGHLAALVEAQRRCEWLLCRYLADMADDHGYRRVGWYSDVLHYARLRLSMSAKVTRERVRIGRALRELPAIEEAFVSGRLGYCRVRELTRVATRDDEQQWLALGLRSGVRELERQVAIGLGVEEPKQEPADVRWRTPSSVELRMQLPASTWALLSRAMEAARERSDSSMSDGQAVEAVAREALAGLCDPDSTEVGDPRRAVVLYRCDDCAQSELETGSGAVVLPPQEAERLACGATVVDLKTEGADDTHPLALDGMSEQARQVWRAMGGRGSWHADELTSETGLAVQQVLVAIMELELSGRIRQGRAGHYAPVGSLGGERGPAVQLCNMDAPRGARAQCSRRTPRPSATRSLGWL